MTNGEALLHELTFGVTSRLDPGFRAGTAKLELQDYVIEFSREVDLRPFNAVVDEAMRRYESATRTQSDSWLGPRLHNALRLTRNEAARRGLWLYLSVAARPDYVIWRWGGEDKDEEPAKVERFAGSDYKHAFARLWWMAELFRNGSDYTPAEQALTNQDIVNNLFRMNIAHQRPIVLSAISVLFPANGKALTGRQANALARAANAAATTLQFDLLAPDPGLEEAAVRLWVETARDVDVVASFDRLPHGPEDQPVQEPSLSVMQEILSVLMREARVRGSEPSRAVPADGGAPPEGVNEPLSG